MGHTTQSKLGGDDKLQLSDFNNGARVFSLVPIFRLLGSLLSLRRGYMVSLNSCPHLGYDNPWRFQFDPVDPEQEQGLKYIVRLIDDITRFRNSPGKEAGNIGCRLKISAPSRRPPTR